MATRFLNGSHLRVFAGDPQRIGREPSDQHRPRREIVAVRDPTGLTVVIVSIGFLSCDRR